MGRDSLETDVRHVATQSVEYGGMIDRIMDLVELVVLVAVLCALTYFGWLK
jgi:hypothetical protein